jgi:branched-chain amino acid transport system ATP-binding protein
MAENNIVLRAENITKLYGGLRAIDNASIYLKKNEVLGLIGPNGAGKTTMFNMISGTVPLTSGRIYVNDRYIHKPAAHKMSAIGIGRTYQVVQPFLNLTVTENTMVGAFLHTRNPKKAKEKSLEVLKFLDLAKKADTPGKDLSLIDLKRMEIARALATDPTILLLDEVMAGLNPVGRDLVMDMIREINKSGISIIIIEHVMRAVMGLCERIYVLSEGRVLAEGTPAEISNNQSVIESYLGGKKVHA